MPGCFKIQELISGLRTRSPSSPSCWQGSKAERLPVAGSAAQLLMGHGGRGAGTEEAWSAKIRLNGGEGRRAGSSWQWIVIR